MKDDDRDLAMQAAGEVIDSALHFNEKVKELMWPVYLGMNLVWAGALCSADMLGDDRGWSAGYDDGVEVERGSYLRDDKLGYRRDPIGWTPGCGRPAPWRR